MDSSKGQDVCGIRDFPLQHVNVTPRLKVVSNFLLQDKPWTQVNVGLSGLNPEILLKQSGGSYFCITLDELRKVDFSRQSAVLSQKRGFKGMIVTCEYSVIGENLVFSRSTSNQVFCEIKLNSYAATQLEIVLPDIKKCAENIVKCKSIFVSMYELIKLELCQIYNDLPVKHSLAYNFDEMYRVFRLYTSPAYLVRLYLTKDNPQCPYQLYQVYDACVSQVDFLKNLIQTVDEPVSFEMLEINE